MMKKQKQEFEKWNLEMMIQKRKLSLNIKCLNTIMHVLMKEFVGNKFVIERGLLDLKKIQKQERKRPKEERDIINAMKPFARFSDKQEHERRVNNLLKEYRLRVLIGQLKYFKSQGLTTLDEIETHIEEK
jgi:transcriptional adapter 2-alpha